MFATPWFGGHQGPCAVADLVGEHEFASREDDGLVQVDVASLIVHREGGQTVDLVAPEIDADGGVGRGREDVDDRTAFGHLAPMLDQFLAPVSAVHQRAQQLVGVERVALANDHR